MLILCLRFSEAQGGPAQRVSNTSVHPPSADSDPGPQPHSLCSKFYSVFFVCLFLTFYFVLKVKVLVTQSCPILCNPIRCRPLGSSVHGILQARILKWIAMPFSRGSSQPRDPTQVSHLLPWQAGSLPLVPPGKLRSLFTAQEIIHELFSQNL